MEKNIPKNPLKFGIFASRTHKTWAITALVAVCIATLFDRLQIVVFKNLTDTITASHINIHNVWGWGIAYPLIYIFAEIFWRTSGFTAMRWFTGLRSSVYETLYGYLSLHSKDYFSNRFAGALVNKISNSAEGVENVLQKILWRFLPLTVGLISYVVITGISSIWLGVIILVWSIIFIIINIITSRELQTRSYKWSETLSVLKGRLVDSLTNISLVHEYAYVAGEQEYINKFVKKQYHAGISSWLFGERVLAVNNILIFIFVTAMISTSIYLFLNHLVTIGVVVMVIAAVSDIGSQLFAFGQELRDTSHYYGQAKEGLQEILREHIITDAPMAPELTLKEGSISVDKIDFEYENTRVFKDFSLNVSAGEKVGLVGRSGAGKTTFVSLLLRHFDVQDGEIKIDGQNIRDVKLASLRRAIAFVPQDTSLFHRTIEENIRYSNPEATKTEVKKAAKAALADDFIKTLPNGYDTLVGERGVKLSGGQRQRIAIARAFLKDAPVLILDEATSSLDSESEHAIQESLDTLMKGRTVIAIAHRLSTLKKMDRIVMLENGKVVEDGKPSDLLKKKSGLFKKMWDHQVEGFIVDE